MTRLKHRVPASGFTLVELCVTVGICATVLGQAIPALSKFRQ